MNLHFGGRADRGPVTGSTRAEQEGGRRTREGRSAAKDGNAVALTAWLRQDHGAGRGRSRPDTKEAAPSAARVRSGGIGSVNRPSAAIGIVFEEDFEVGIVELVSG